VSFSTVLSELDPGLPETTIKPFTNLNKFWLEILVGLREATSGGEIPYECTIMFARGDFYLVEGVLDKILNGPERDWLPGSAKKALVELRNFFHDRLHDPDLDQTVAGPYRREEALLNDLYFGKQTAIKAEDLVSPPAHRIIVFGVLLALMMPDERQAFSIVSVAGLMANLFGWNPVRTLEEINTYLERWNRKPGSAPERYKDEQGLVRIKLPAGFEDSPEIPDLKPPSSPRDLIVFAVAMALLVPEENRRRRLALQSIALIMRDLFGWSQKRVTEEINLCVETWNEDGVRPNFWTDEAGQVNVGIPKCECSKTSSVPA
jgi:hypothetical protein